MKRVALGRPLSTTTTGKLDWILMALHKIEVASSERDVEFDTVVARLDTIDARLVDIEARLDAIDARFDDYTPTLHAVVTYDPPSIATNSSVNVVVPVPGAQLGDVAELSFDQPRGNMVVRAEIFAPDEVTVNFLNPTSGPIDLPEGALRVIVFRVT